MAGRRRYRISYRKPKISILVATLFVAIVVLYVGGTMMSELGETINGSESGLYQGFTLIGWTVGDYPMFDAENFSTSCSNPAAGNAGTTSPGSYCVTDVSTGGVVTIVGLIAIAAVLLQFVRFQRL